LPKCTGLDNHLSMFTFAPPVPYWLMNSAYGTWAAVFSISVTGTCTQLHITDTAGFWLHVIKKLSCHIHGAFLSHMLKHMSPQKWTNGLINCKKFLWRVHKVSYVQLLTYLLHGFSPQANYTDRETTACRRS
jgi:hypothetical protein